MAERSIIARLKADISDLRAGMRSAQTDIKAVAAAAEKANQAQVQSSKAVQSAEKIRAATRQATAAQEIRASGQQVTAAEKYGRTTAYVREHDQALRTLGSGLTKVGIAAGLGFGVAVKSAAEFDQGMSNVAATGDDARKNIGALRAEALQLGADTKFSATESAAGIENLLKAGVSAQDTLGGGLKGALDLAAAGQISVADASETAATALTQFGLSGRDVPHVADLLAAGAGKAQGEVADMAAALGQGGLVASQFGLSIEDTTGTLAAFASAGLIGSDAGTSFKTMLLALSNPSKQSRKEMDELGISAYDAQGKFIGITNLAEQLKSRLSGLTEEQRNAALAQIFGNDAVRAANVLYKEGASGITDWIGKVNDQGYAAETAATKMDNLNGDLEQLKGALSTALIGGGSGSTGALRDITQLVTRLVNGFNDLDPATQSAAVKVLAVVAALGLGGAAVIKLITSLAAGRAALIELGVAARVNAAGGLGAITPAALGAAAAVAAVAVAAVALDKAGQQGQGPGAITSQLLELSTAGTQASSTAKQVNAAFGQTGAIDEFTSLIEGTVPPVDNLTTALQVQANAAPGTLSWLSGLREKILPGQQSLEKLTAGIHATDESFSQLAQNGQVGQAQKAFAVATKDAGLSADQLVAAFPQFRAALQDSANELGVTGLSAQDFAGWMQGIVPPSIAAAQAQAAVKTSAVDLAPALDSTRASLTALAQVSELSAQQSADLSKSVFAEGDAYQASVTAHTSYADAIDQASAAIDKNGEHLTKNKQALSDNAAAGRENITALNQLASSGKDYVRALIDQGASSEEAQAATGKVRAEFVKAAEAAGLGKKAAAELADSYGLIPDKVSTEFDAFGLALQQQKVADYQNALAALPDDVRSQIDAIYHKDGAEAAIAELDRIDGKTATPDIKPQADLKPIKGVLSEMDKLHDKKVRALTSGDTKGADKVDRAMKDLASRTVKALTKGDTSGSAKVDRAQKALRDKLVRAISKGDTSGARAVLQALNELHNKTVYAQVVKKTITVREERKSADVNVNRDGGYIRPVNRRDGGGVIVGRGGPRDDNIAGIDEETGQQTTWVSVGEFVNNERSTAANRMGLEMINAGKGQKFKVTPLADGGAVSLASTGAAGAATILALVRALTNPLADIAKAKATLDRENTLIARPRGALDTATRRYDRNVERRQDLRERVADLKRAADATKGQTKADREYKRALADLRDANNAVTRSTAEKKKAQEAYDAVADKSKAAAEALKQAQDDLATATRGVSDTFRESYVSKSADARDLIQLAQDGAKDLTAFTAKIAALRKLGLNETTIQQAVTFEQQNPGAGSDLATEIAAGGKGLVDQLNAANAALQKAADNLGYLSATGVQRHAGGGLVVGPGTGTSDSVPMFGSAGEYVERKAAVDHYGLPFMQDVNNLRYQPPQVSAAPVIDMEALRALGVHVTIERMYGGDPTGVAKAIDTKRRDNLASSGLAYG